MLHSAPLSERDVTHSTPLSESGADIVTPTL